MKKHGKAKPKSYKGTIGPIRSKRIGKGSAARSGKPRKPHKPHRLARKVRKSSKRSKSPVRKMRVSKKPSGRAGKQKAKRPPLVKRPKPAAVAVSGKKAADEIPTLEQVTITCANCGRPFKVMKLKGLSLEGTICQRCSLGEMELPESFG